MVRILITGSGGGIGRAVTERLRAFGASLAPAYPGPLEVVSLTREQMDVTRREHVEQAFREHRPEIVIDAAGRTDLDQAEVYQWEAYLVNRDGTEHLARECQQSGALLVYFSSDLVFDGARRVPYAEEDPPNPLLVYGDTKLAAELVIMKQRARHLILRTGWVYGQPGRHFLKLVQDGPADERVLLADDEQVGQPTYVQDLFDAMIFLLSRGLAGTYHASNAGETTQFGALKRCVQAMGWRQVEVRGTRRPADGRSAARPRYSVLNCDKLARAGWKMRPWEAALSAFVLHLAEKKSTETGTARWVRTPDPPEL